MARITYIAPTPRRGSALRPLRLHRLIGGEPAWTDSLWDEVMPYLDRRLSLPQAITLSRALIRLDSVHGEYMDQFSFGKRGRLTLFREYPPSVLLAAFDYCRMTLWK